MSATNNLPFPIGNTFFQGGTVDSTAANGILGNEYIVSDREFGLNTGRMVTIRAVRNTNANTLLPKLGVHYDIAQKYGTAVGYGTQGHSYSLTIPLAGIVDPMLPSSGCPYNDICYIVVKGPCIGKTGHTVAPAIAVGDLCQAWATSSGGTTGATSAGAVGRFWALTNTASTAQVGDILLASYGLWGRAMTARTTNETHTDTLIDLFQTVG